MKKLFLLISFGLFLSSAYSQIPALSFFKDDVEGQKDFAINSFIGWTAVDIDKQPIEAPYQDFPNKDSLQAFMVFNPSKTDPPVTFDSWKPYSENKMFVSFSKEESNSYLISPLINCPNGGKFSFYANSATLFGDIQSFKIGYSSTGSDIADFTFLNNNKPYENDGAWKLYTADIPVGSKYITIACVSSGTMMGGLCIDNIDFVATPNGSAPAASSISITPNQMGNKEATISFTLANKNVSGTDLSEISCVYIYRGTNTMELSIVDSVKEGLLPNKDFSYTDKTIPSSGSYYYCVVQSNTNGAGMPSFATKTYIGKETVAGAPRYISIEKDPNNKNILKWNKINYGERGGVLESPVQGYTVLRAPVSSPTQTKELAKFITDTSFTETDVLDPYLYIYTVYGQLSALDKGISLSQNAYSGLEESSYGVGSSNITDSYFPLSSFSYASYLSQSIYTPEQISEKGFINSISYLTNSLWDSYDEAASQDSMALKIYLSTTERDNFGEEGDIKWFFYGDQTLVFDSLISLKKPGNISTINLQKGFYFDPTGNKNLVITLIRPQTQWTNGYSSASFFVSPTSDIKSYSATGYTVDLSTATVQPSAISSNTGKLVPNIIYKTNSMVNKLHILTESNANSIVDSVSIELNPINTDLYTDYSGYTLKNGLSEPIFLFPGKYKLKLSKVGWATIEKEIILEESKNDTLLFKLSDVLPMLLSGIVVNKDNSPISGAEVIADGFSKTSAKTDEKGFFNLDIYQGQDYKLLINHPLYLSFDTFFTTNELEKDTLRSIELGLNPISPSNLQAIINTESITELSWDAPVGLSEYKMLQWGNATIGTSWSAGGTEFTAAVKFDEHDLNSICGNNPDYFITSIKTHISNRADFFVEIYSISENEEPILIHSQEESVDKEGWYNFELNKYIPVDISKSLYLAIRFPAGYGSFPMGLDEGPCIIGKGNMINEGKGWTTIGLTNKNWAIYGNIALLNQASPSGYSVYRKNMDISTGTKADVDNYNLIASGITQTSYSDNTLKDAGAGIYQYAISATYPQSEASKYSYSNIIRYLVDFDINIKVNPVADNNVFISLQNSDIKEIYKDSLSKSGAFSFKTLQKGSYMLSILCDNYEPFEEEIVISRDTSLYITLSELICAPSSASAVRDASNSIHVEWDISAPFLQTFEAYDKFENKNLYPATTLDIDKASTYVYPNFRFPLSGQPMSFIIFTPSATTPPQKDIKPYAGRRFLANFSEETVKSNDWYIFPAKGGEVSFMARSLFSEVLENFKLLYSTTNNNTSSFKPIAPDNAVFSVPTSYTEYKAIAPDNTKYIAIQGVSQESYLLLIDNLKYERPYNHAISYKIYVDDNLVKSDHKEKSITLNNVDPSAKKIGIVAVYSDGESEKTIVDITNVGNQNNQKVLYSASLYPNPTNSNTVLYLPLDEEFSIKISNYSGNVIFFKTNQKGAIDILLDDKAPGIYFVELLKDNTTVKTFKLIKQ